MNLGFLRCTLTDVFERASEILKKKKRAAEWNAVLMNLFFVQEEKYPLVAASVFIYSQTVYL